VVAPETAAVAVADPPAAEPAAKAPRKPRSRKVAEAAEPVAAEPIETAAESELPLAAPTRAQIARRAFALFRQGEADPVTNWLRAERELQFIVQRAYDLWREGSPDAVANWLRAEAELDG
jgi:hypothetical protein